jgi:hypothetical protein
MLDMLGLLAAQVYESAREGWLRRGLLAEHGARCMTRV